MKNKVEKQTDKVVVVVHNEKNEPQLVPPDGGWGWLIVLGYGLSNMIMIPILQNFGLIYKDRLLELEFSSTDITTLVTLNSWFGMILGIFNAPLLKKYGYRKMAFYGVTMFTIGTFSTAFANSYLEFVVFYGVLSSLGLTYTMSSFSLAMNSYFKKKRNFAASRVTTLQGLGPIFVPLIISELLKSYGSKWTVLLLGALNLHGYVGVALLHPLKWYMKPAEIEDEEEGKEETLKDSVEVEAMANFGSMFGVESIEASNQGSRRTSLSSFKQTMYMRSTSQEKGGSLLQVNKIIGTQDTVNKRPGLVGSDKTSSYRNAQRKEVKSLTLMDIDDIAETFGSTLGILETADTEKKKMLASVESLDEAEDQEVKEDPSEKDKFFVQECEPVDKDDDDLKTKRTCWGRFMRYIVKTYDLDLLADPIYWNLTVGMSIAINGELAFSLLTPFILNDLGLTTEQIAVFVAVIAGADMVCRFLAPYIQKYLKFGSRKMYIASLFFLLATRLGLFLTNNFTELIAVAVGLGIGKGFRTVYWILVVPDYVPLEKLASASAFQNLSTGLFLIVAGPMLGLIVQINNKYINLIYASNVMTATTILLWTLEFTIVACMERKKRRKELSTNQR